MTRQWRTFSMRGLIGCVLLLGIVFGAGRMIWRHNRGTAVDEHARDMAVIGHFSNAQVKYTLENILPDRYSPIANDEGFYRRVNRLVIRSAGRVEIPTTIGRLEHVQAVFISGQVDAEAVERLAQLPRLDSLDIQSDAIEEGALSRLSAAQGLAELGLRGSKLSPSVLGELAHLPRLGALDLGETVPGEAGIRALGACEPIRTMTLDGCPLGDAEVEALLELYSVWTDQDLDGGFSLRVWPDLISEQNVLRLRAIGVDVYYGSPRGLHPKSVKIAQ